MNHDQNHWQRDPLLSSLGRMTAIENHETGSWGTRRLVLCLGTNDYAETVYRVDGQEPVLASFFGVALAQWLKPDVVTALVTPEARQKNGELLRAALEGTGCQVDFVSIDSDVEPKGGWDLFEALAKAAGQAGDTVYLDVTYGYRMLPMIALAASSYLGAVRDIRIGGIYYAVFARGQAETPVVNLSRFLELQEWLIAARSFSRTGRADDLAAQLRAAEENWRAHYPETWDVDEDDRPLQLGKTGDAIREAAANISLLRRNELVAGRETMEKQLDLAAGEWPVHARPFGEIVDLVRSEIHAGSQVGLQGDRERIGWLREKGQTMAAMTLAREWLTDLAATWCGCRELIEDRSHRDACTSALNALTKAQKPDFRPGKTSELEEEWQARLSIPERLTPVTRMLEIRKQITDLRNDLNHAGYPSGSKQPKGVREIEELSSRLIEELQQLPLELPNQP